VEVLISGVTDGFFDLLGLPMAAGRGFTPEEFVPSGPNAPTALVLSYHLWAEMFGRDPAIVGRSLNIAEFGGRTTIVGVAASEMDLPHGTDFWMALRIDPRSTGHSFIGILRLRPGTRIEALQSGAAAAMASQARTSPTDVGRAYVMEPLLASIVGDLGSTLLIVLGAAGLLLLLACVNVTDLLLARGAARTRELATRAALGASRGRIIRQLLIETLVLACGGAVCGVALAYAGVRLLLMLGASRLPRLTAVPFDAKVLVFAIGVLVFSALAMGIAPAARLSRADIGVLLNESGRSATPGRSAARSMSALIVIEVALAIVLAAGAGWLVQSFARLESVDPGFAAAGRVVVSVKTNRRFDNPAQSLNWWNTALERIRAVSGVAEAGSAITFPLGVERDGNDAIEVEGEVSDPNHPLGARLRPVTPGFFAAMGIKLLAGRDFTADDRQATMPVAIVNQAFARRYLGMRNPLTTKMSFGFPNPDPRTLRPIIGVVEDVRYKSLSEDAEPAFYLPETQTFSPREQTVAVAAHNDDPSSLISGIRSALTAFDPQVVVKFDTAPAMVAGTLTRQRLGMTLMLIFGVLALLLAAIGIYGVIAYASTQRRAELATRIALGASAGQIFWLVMSSGQRLALIGIAVGLAGAYAGGRIVASSVYAMRAFDPAVLFTAAALVALLTFVATMIPALWATRLNPARVLRSD
jgi:putative ABC transport system permease protein